MTLHRIKDLIEIFDSLFRQSHGTVLVKGDDEPIYLPRDEENPFDRIVFAHGYFASALHEISHWCIAGKRRLRLVDYGYWYKPDGRSREEQIQFEKVEVKPQALEMIFSMACNKPFTFSRDNLDGPPHDTRPFQTKVLDQVHRYLNRGLPKRASRLVTALTAFYGTGESLSPPLLSAIGANN